MKRVVVMVVLMLVIGHNCWAKRAEITSIARDPYVSALAIEADSGKVLFSDNPEAKVYPASVVKLMDLLIILERIGRGENRLDEMVQITPEAAKIGGSQVYLDPKEQFSIEDLLYALAVQSANDAAVALAIHISGSKEGFVALMNQRAAELGMTKTHFFSVHGLPPSAGQQIDHSTAGDLALLCRALVVRPEALQYTGTKEHGFRNNSFIMRNHNHLLGQVMGCDGLKTGYFEAAGFSIAATAQRNGNRVIAVIMGSKGRKVRDAKAAELLNTSLAKLPPKSKPAGEIGQSAQPLVPPAGAPHSTASAQPPSSPPPASTPTVQEKAADSATPVSGFSWIAFAIGMVAGIILTVGLSFVLRRKPPPVRTY